MFQLLLYEATQNNLYKEDIEAFINDYNGTTVLMTPCGLSYVDKWGSNRYAGTQGFSTKCNVIYTLQC